VDLQKRAGGQGQELSKEALLFVNKKKQKNFMSLHHAAATPVAQINRSFLVLFFKKEPPCFAFSS
jgi:hypothetical protein